MAETPTATPSFTITALLLAVVLGFAVAAATEDGGALEAAKAGRALAAEGRFAEALERTEQALALASAAYGPEHEYTAYILDDLATLHYRRHRLGKAIPLARQAVAIIRKRRGPDSIEFAALANNLGTLLFGQGLLEEAESLYRDAHRIFRRELGAVHERTAQAARNLGLLLVERSQIPAAKGFFVQALNAYRSLGGEESPEVAKVQLSLAGVYLREENTAGAWETASQARDVLAGQFLPDLPELARAEVALARIEIQRSRLDEAAARLDAMLAKLGRAGLEADLAAATVLYHIGFVHILRGQAVEAESVYKQTLAIYRTQLGDQHPAVARTLHGLAIAYQELGEYDEAARLYERAIATFASSTGLRSPPVGATRLEYSLLLSERGEARRAVAEARRALAIFAQPSGPFAIKRAYALSALGFGLHRSGELTAAAQAFEQANDLMIALRGEGSSDLPPGLTERGEIALKLGRLESAEQVLTQAIAIREKDGAATAAGLARSLSVLARVRAAQGRLGEALAISRRIVGILEARLGVAQEQLSGAALGEQRKARALFEQFLNLATASRKASKDKADPLLEEMFRVGQFPHLSGTAAAVSRMAVRFQPDEPRLAALIRQREDAVERWRRLDRQWTDRLALTADEPPARAAEGDASTALRMLSREIESIDRLLEQDFPDFSELTNPRPVALSLIQGLLGPDEALLLQVTGKTGTFLFAVRRDRVAMAHTAMTQLELERLVAAVRQGLDLQNVKKLSELPPFDTGAAHALYRNLILPIEASLKGVRHIVAVLDGAMQSLPPSVLLVSPVKQAPRRLSAFRHLDFLGRHYAFSVLPSVSALKALRSIPRNARTAKQRFAGFGDPDLEGGKAGIRSTAAQLTGKLVTAIDPDLLRSLLLPLPETRQELLALSEALDGDQDALFFGEQATETTVKAQDLHGYRIIAFATHGLLAGEFRGLAEPALVLTPPAAPSPRDDGLLTASEIATLKLDADWVLLSACNTAAPAGRPGAEGLSGLARAFFYAGSRALMVSHWWVASDASVLLTTGAVARLAADPRIGRAEALRQAMLPLMNGKLEPHFAHPVFWGPFVTVGEGGGKSPVR